MTPTQINPAAAPVVLALPSFALTMANGDRFRCRLEHLTQDLGRWVLTDPDGLAHIGPDAIPNETHESAVVRLVAWWHGRNLSGHWQRAPRPD